MFVTPQLMEIMKREFAKLPQWRKEEIVALPPDDQVTELRNLIPPEERPTGDDAMLQNLYDELTDREKEHVKTLSSDQVFAYLYDKQIQKQRGWLG
jgi:hypothetical protein